MRILSALFLLGILSGTFFAASSRRAQAAPQSQSGGIPVTVTITVLPKSGAEPVEFHQDELLVKQDGVPRPVISVVPPDDPGAKLNLAILLDPDMTAEAKVMWKDLQNFIRSLPQGSRVAIAKAEKGRPVMEQNFTTDLDLGAKSLKFPDITATPNHFYSAIASLCQTWPNTPGRRVLLTIGPGIGYPGDAKDAIAQAQRGGVVVYAIPTYASAPANDKHRYSSDLGVMQKQTGGEIPDLRLSLVRRLVPTHYTWGIELPYISVALKESYLITFLATPSAKDEYAPFEATVNAKDVIVVGPARVFVPGAH